MKLSLLHGTMSATRESTTRRVGRPSSSSGQDLGFKSTIAASSTKTNKTTRITSNSLLPNTLAIDTIELVTLSTSALKFVTKAITGCNENRDILVMAVASSRTGTSTKTRFVRCISCTRVKSRRTGRGGDKSRKLATLSSLPRLESSVLKDATSGTSLAIAESRCHSIWTSYKTIRGLSLQALADLTNRSSQVKSSEFTSLAMRSNPDTTKTQTQGIGIPIRASSKCKEKSTQTLRASLTYTTTVSSTAMSRCITERRHLPRITSSSK